MNSRASATARKLLPEKTAISRVKWSSIKEICVAEQLYFPKLVIAGQRIDLSHLEPFTK